MLIPRRLSRDDLYKITEQVAVRNDLKMLPADAFKVASTTDEVLITCNNRGVMWVNRDFIAYILNECDVRYVYMTKHHINCERASYSCSSKREELPEDTARAFRHAEECMKQDKTTMWIDDEYTIYIDEEEI